MEELVDILNEENGQKTLEVISKDEAHRLGLWHGAVHIFIVSEDKKKVLLQKRCSEKKLFPNMWDITVGGHISTGEDSLLTAKRELSEELGLDADKYNFEYVKTIKEKFVYNDIISNEFVDVYKIVSDIEKKEITLQKEEVSDVDWFTKSEFNKLIEDKKLIDHDEEYQLINEILGE